ncbi:hypothetical protein PFISCL1PPCAC_25793, partial [Pristionchus fissidentatus]
ADDSDDTDEELQHTQLVQQVDETRPMSPSSAFLLAYQQQMEVQQEQMQLQQQQQAQQLQERCRMLQEELDREAARKLVHLIYLDPSGVERGPFTLDQMEALFKTGYFADSLEVRRGCDREFTELGELKKRNTENPFEFTDPIAVPTANVSADCMD